MTKKLNHHVHIFQAFPARAEADRDRLRGSHRILPVQNSTGEDRGCSSQEDRGWRCPEINNYRVNDSVMTEDWFLANLVFCLFYNCSEMNEQELCGDERLFFSRA